MPVHVTGLRGSSSVFLPEALRDRLDRPVAVICPDQETAEDVTSDLGTLSTVRVLSYTEILFDPR